MRPRSSDERLLRIVTDHRRGSTYPNALPMVSKKGGEGVEGNLPGFA